MKKIHTFALTLLITGAIDSIRNLPATALFGSTLIFFFIFSAIVFLVPTALVSAHLTAQVDEGGIYQWASSAFNKRIGFLAIWLQWINNLFWFPTMFSFIAGTAAYLVDPALAQNKFYMVSFILPSFWLLTILNLRGVRLSSRFTGFCALTGLIIPMIFIIGSFILWMIQGNPLQMHLTAANAFPHLGQSDNWMALTAIMLGFAGMELASVHIKDVHQAQKTYPRAVAFSTIIILITMTLGSLAIAFVVPQNQINLVNGTIQTLSFYLLAWHLSWLIPVLTVMLILGSVGGVISWMISPARGLGQAAKDGFLPPILQKHNAHGVPQNLLIAQAIVVSIISMAFLLLPTINASFWLLTALTTQLYIMMYVLLFLSALRLHKKIDNKANAFVIPGKSFGMWLTCLLGLAGSLITLVVGFIPPSNIDIGSKMNYELLFCGGLVIMLLPVLFLNWYQAKNTSRENGIATESPELI